jgi:pimeloyl-ACP methyl ester carboxylesterase
MAERLPDARLEIMDEVGHAPFLSRPADFNLMLRKFLDGINADD